MTKKRSFIRYFVVIGIFIAAIFMYGGRLLNMQIANATQFQPQRSEIFRTERLVIPAVRGEIFDRNGIPLVTNRLIYNITVNGARFPRTRNQLADTEHLINLVRLIKLYGGEVVPHTLPVISIDGAGGTQRFTYSMAALQNETARDAFYRFLSANTIPQHISANDLMSRLAARYGLDELMPPEERDNELFMAVLGICYELDRRSIIPHRTSFAISTDISDMLVKAVRENSHDFPGVEITKEYSRIHHVPHSAPHLIGRIGRIQPHQWPRFRELGYPMDALVGQSGAEAAFEHFLRGWDGIRLRHFDIYGNIIGEEYYREPIPGKNVYLTLDIKLQQVAEHSVRQTIKRIREYGEASERPMENGADASAGSTAIIDPNTGQVLALATYPSFNLATFNEDFAELNRHPGRPQLNRALQGQYPPGSVFKIVTSIAALSSGHLTTTELIEDRGVFTQYQQFQPRCWRWVRHRLTCGNINVSRALQVSCNYFYFVVGRRMAADNDIALLNSYARRMGLGVHTGVGFGEVSGMIASRANRTARAGTWFPGDTLQAAIGQSDYMFSPIQMSVMLGTVLTGGTRYKTQLLLYVREFGADGIYYAPEPQIADQFEIAPEHLEAVKIGMRDVFELGGTAAVLFRDLPGLTTGGKTGTAQVQRSRSSHATIVAFAPFEEPELSMSVVIEHGARGTWSGFVAEDVFAYYFGYKTFREALGLPEEEPEEEY